jgi:amidase
MYSLGPRDLLCLPTAPTIAPLKGTASHDRQGDYYSRTLSLTSLAGVARLPQVSMPLATASSTPIGLSLVAAHGEDLWLLEISHMIDEHSRRSR